MIIDHEPGTALPIWNGIVPADAYTPMGAAAEELYTRFADLGGDKKDFSAIIKMIDDSWVASPGSKPVSLPPGVLLPE